MILINQHRIMKFLLFTILVFTFSCAQILGLDDYTFVQDTDTDSIEVADTTPDQDTETDSIEDTDTTPDQDTETDSIEDTDTIPGQDTETDNFLILTLAEQSVAPGEYLADQSLCPNNALHVSNLDGIESEIIVDGKSYFAQWFLEVEMYEVSPISIIVVDLTLNIKCI